MSTVSQNANTVLLRLALSDETLAVYEQQAKAQNKSVEQIIEKRLWMFSNVDSTKPIVLNDQARQHLEKLLARNFTTADELVASIQRALTCKIDEVAIPCSPYLLERLRTRCLGMEFPKFLQATVKKLLEEYAGLR